MSNKRIKELKLDNFVGFTGAIPQEEIINFYQNSDLFINLSSTGSLDKAILEAMSCGSNVLTSNEAFKGILPKECLTTNDQKQITDNLRLFIDKKPNLNLREYVVGNHKLDILVSKISTEIKKHEHSFFKTKQNYKIYTFVFSFTVHNLCVICFILLQV
jgi:hypothetical protein